MKKLMLILTCVLICAVSCKQKTTQQESQTEPELGLQDMAICQSCGMPMTEDLLGTNADSTLNGEYCKYCYAAGEFTMPEATMTEMVEVCVPFMVEQGWTADEARKAMEEMLPTLNRWKQE